MSMITDPTTPAVPAGAHEGIGFDGLLKPRRPGDLGEAISVSSCLVIRAQPSCCHD